jgi:hypothetical protein
MKDVGEREACRMIVNGHSRICALNDKLKKLAPAQRAAVERRAAELIAEELSLRERRKALIRSR